MSFDIESEWKKAPKPDNGLRTDGDFYGIVGQALVRSVQDGQSELFEVPVTVSDGEYAGEELDIAYFYQCGGKINEIAFEQVKKLSDQVDVRIRETSASFMASLDLLSRLLTGRKVKFKQVTSKKGFINHTILEVLESHDTAALKQTEPVINDSDIPF